MDQRERETLDRLFAEDDALVRGVLDALRAEEDELRPVLDALLAEDDLRCRAALEMLGSPDLN